MLDPNSLPPELQKTYAFLREKVGRDNLFLRDGKIAVNSILTIHKDELVDGRLPDLSNVIVYHDFMCNELGLKTLVGCPHEVHGTLDCSKNELQDFQGFPERIHGLECGDNNLTSLSGLPEEIDGSLNCTHNLLKDLSGTVKTIKGDFDCSYNALQTLKGLPEVEGELVCDYNKSLSQNYFC